jgi:RNA polymerase sigma-70 factor, ECF subfamily
VNKFPKSTSIPDEKVNGNDVDQGAEDAEVQSQRSVDFALVERARAGDRTAFRTLYDKYNRRAYQLALGVVHNPDEALDVVQEAFLRAHKHLDSFEGNASLYTWLYRIVMNVSIDHLRKQNRAPTVDYDDAVAHLESDAPADTAALIPQLVRGNPAKELARREIREKIDEALDKLSPNHRAVLIMREIDGLSYEEMAKSMKCSKGTIMSRLFHARRYMQKYLLEFLGKKDFEV